MTALMRPGPIVPDVVEEHASEAAAVWTLRRTVAVAPHAKLSDLARFDERLVAFLDGLALAGEEGWTFCAALLEDQSAEAAFVATVRSIEEKQEERLDSLFALADAVPDTRAGLISAFGWLEPRQLQGTVAGLLRADHPLKRALGLAACGVHRVDPDLANGGFLEDANALVRARALRTAGDLGTQPLLPPVTAAIADADGDCQFWSARSAVLLGDRARGMDALARIGVADGPFRARAFRLALQAMPAPRGHALLQRLAADATERRWLIQGSAIVGDPAYVPWLIGQMAANETTRVAGEAFTLITGVDLVASHLDGPPPEGFESGPNDNPDDADVGIDPDDGLPWPDPKRVQDWWNANGARFEPGTRFFMGAPVTRAHCIAVLRTGCQRQRVLAAHHLCLLDPGKPLFNTSAPAGRQQRMLAQLE